MDQPSQGQSELVRLARKVGIFVASFVVGGLVAFVYSYLPLHNAKNWRIEYLSERLESKDARLERLEADLASVKTEAADKPDGQTFKLLQQELVTTDRTIKDLESKLAKAERRIKEIESSRSGWQKRHAEAEAERAALASRLERRSSGWPLGDASNGALDADGAAPEVLPAAPAPAQGEPSTTAAQ